MTYAPAYEPSLQLQKAIYEALRANTALTGLLADPGIDSIYDFVPDGAAFPYIQIGDDTVVEDGDDTARGFECTITLHVFDQGRSRKRVKEIMGAIADTLDRREAALPMPNFYCYLCMFDFSETNIDQDSTGLYPHGIIRFRLKIRTEANG